MSNFSAYRSNQDRLIEQQLAKASAIATSLGSKPWSDIEVLTERLKELEEALISMKLPNPDPQPYVIKEDADIEEWLDK